MRVNLSFGLSARRQSNNWYLRRKLAARALKPHNASGSALPAGRIWLTEKKMRLTLHTDYSLRVLIHVAVADGKLITISDIAESFDISKQHLMKVVSDLSQKGYLDTVRGRGGGIRLRGSPHDINIGQVVRQTEDKLDVIGCLGQRGYCPIERVCVLRGVLYDAMQAFLAVLDGYTLADLIKPQRALASLLLHDQHAAHAS
jgi:Rrf2 family transcriptional regulator, nitric oxide-sensitive transcriptional repressor